LSDRVSNFDESDEVAATKETAVTLPGAPSPSLDTLLARARDASVRSDLAAARVAELDRWARTEHARSRWLSFGVGLAAAALVAVVIAWRAWPGAGGAGSPIQVGDRVTIVAEPHTRYRVASSTEDRTEIVVEAGAITARLWPGAHAHRLALRGGDVTAVATGTIYTLAVDGRGAHVSVYEGHVDVAAGDTHHEVAAGTTWSARGDGAAAGGVAADVLRGLAPPAPIADAAPLDAAPNAASPAPVIDASVAQPDGPADARRLERDAALDDAPARSLTERWRDVRMLRAQNKLDAAVAECLALADANDATWSPIALVEAIRIELGPHASPERAIELADRMARQWPSHVLAAEARELRCRALRQLGRDAECAPPP
jgi:hypothetical protein